jgi:DNA-binding MarR family transcriptional regulator
MAEPVEGPEHIGPHARISYVIARLDRAIRREIADMAAPHGLTATQFTALSVLRTGKGLSNAQLARRSYVTPQSMIEMLGTLENKGLVQRAPAPDHGRIMHVELTARGRRVLAQCDAEIDRIEENMTRELSPAQLAAFERTLRSCVHMLGAGLPDA